jgi:hypothetical protein
MVTVLQHEADRPSQQAATEQHKTIIQRPRQRCSPDRRPSGITAGRAFGIGRTLAYELALRDEFPCPVHRVGSLYRVKKAELIVALGMAKSKDA